MPEKFNYVKKGYDPLEVDVYINSLENVLKSYKDKDNAIKNALINAQIAADNIIRNAELEAENSKAKAVAQLDVIIRSVDKQKAVVDNFKNDYHALISTYLKEINEAEFSVIYSKISELENFLNSLKGVPPAEQSPE